MKKLSKKELAEKLRQQVDTVGKEGKPGEQIQNVISVGMLSEGWDARTVTHIMGLRAFSSQLLCEQVVGRGLRRVSYEFDKEKKPVRAGIRQYLRSAVHLLTARAQDGPPPPPPAPKTKIEPVIEKKEFEISWPNVIRIDHVYRQELKLDFAKVKPLELDALKTPTLAEVAPIVEGKPDVTKLSEITLEELARKKVPVAKDRLRDRERHFRSDEAELEG